MKNGNRVAGASYHKVHAFGVLHPSVRRGHMPLCLGAAQDSSRPPSHSLMIPQQEALADNETVKRGI